MIYLKSVLLVSAVFLPPKNSYAERVDDRAKLIGKQAPQIKIEKWTSNAKLPKLEKFKADQLYLIYFHSFGPVRTEQFLKSIAEPVKRKVTVILIDSRDSDEIEDFLDEIAFGSDPPLANRELLADIRYLDDSEFKVTEKFFADAQEKGVRETVLIGKNGRIEWVGHYHDAPTVVEKVAKRNWDSLDYVSFLENNSRVFKAINECISAAKSPEDLQRVTKLIQKYRSEFKDLKSKRLRAIFAAYSFEALLKVNSPEKFDALKTAIKESGEHTDAIVATCWKLASNFKEQKSQGKKIDQKVNQALIKALSQIEKEHPTRVDVINTKSQLLYAGGHVKEAITAQEKMRKLPQGRSYPDSDLKKWKAELGESKNE